MRALIDFSVSDQWEHLKEEAALEVKAAEEKEAKEAAARLAARLEAERKAKEEADARRAKIEKQQKETKADAAAAEMDRKIADAMQKALLAEAIAKERDVPGKSDTEGPGPVYVLCCWFLVSAFVVHVCLGSVTTRRGSVHIAPAPSPLQ